LFCYTFSAFAQDAASTNSNSTGIVTKPSRDFLMLQIGYNNWANKPDSVRTKPIGYVFNAFVCYDFPIKKSRLSFATGLGINVNVVYLDQQRLVTNDTSVINGTTARFIPDTGRAYTYKRYKFVTSYLTAPFELRYFSNTKNRNKGFKASIGMNVGLFVGAHTKGVASVGGINVKDKEDTKRYMSTWNFATTARVGYGNFALFMSYNLTTVFAANQGPPVTPYSFGLCVTGL
jgi:Outer membrane protein beta-barrel domain